MILGKISFYSYIGSIHTLETAITSPRRAEVVLNFRLSQPLHLLLSYFSLESCHGGKQSGLIRPSNKCQ